MTNWLKDCEICNTGLCSEMDRFVKLGLSERKAAQELEKQQEISLGTKLYSSTSILNRYRYHTAKKKVNQNDSHEKKREKPREDMSDDEIMLRNISTQLKQNLKDLHQFRISHSNPGSLTPREKKMARKIQKRCNQIYEILSWRDYKLTFQPGGDIGSIIPSYKSEEIATKENKSTSQSLT